MMNIGEDRQGTGAKMVERNRKRPWGPSSELEAIYAWVFGEITRRFKEYSG
jgi:hypothetical protein